MRPAFQDPVLQDQFSRDGFVIVPCLTDEEVVALNSKYDELPTHSQQGFFSGIYTRDRGFKVRSNDILKGLAYSFSEKYLLDYRLLIGNFVLKHSDDQSVMPCHQDWTCVDERRYSSINIWCALTDMNFQNGALHLVPGSHRLPLNVRGTNIPDSLGQIQPISYDQMECLEIKAGHAIVHDHRIIHGSPPNKSGKRRLATAICMIPREAAPKHFCLDFDNHKLEAYAIDTNFFFEHSYGNVKLPPLSNRHQVYDDFEQHRFDQAELSSLLRSSASDVKS